MMTRSPDNISPNLAAAVRRQFRDRKNVSYLQSLPAFRVDTELPSQFQRMLEQVDAAEAARMRPDGDS